MVKSVFSLAVLLLSVPLEAAPPNNKITRLESVAAWKGTPISEVQVKGNQRIERDAIIEKVSSRKGARVSLESVRSDIEAIHEMGFFDEVEVNATGTPGKSAILTYVLRERPVIEELTIEGNEKIDTDDLKEVIKIKEWAILDVNLIREDLDRIHKHYEQKGFYLTKVNYRLEPGADDGKVKLFFEINDYEKVRIKKITFLNNTRFSDDELKKVFQETQEGGFWSFLSGSGSFKDTGFKQDLQRLTYWYLDHGYIKFRYENPVVTVSDDKKWLFVSIFVEEGESYDMGEVDFSGDLLFSKEELAERLSLEKGDEFRISERNSDIQMLTEKYQDLGYAFVNVIPRMNVDDERKIVDITYHFEKGNLVYFGEIKVTGNSKTHDKVIRRELRIHEGELFNGTNLRISKDRVERLGYFQPGELIFNQLTRKGRDDIVDIEIKIKERSTGTVTLGAGYGSVQKFFLTTQVSEINLLGRGQTLSLQGQWAADNRSRRINLGFTDPYAFDTDWSMGFDAFYDTAQNPGRYVIRKLGFDVKLGYPIADDIRAFVTYKNENSVVTEKVIDSLEAGADEGVLSSVVLNLVRDVRNNRFEPTKGSLQSASVEYAGLGGDKFFVKAVANNRFYYRIAGDLVFRNSIEYGQITQLIDGKVIPPNEKFYLGGPNSLKGFRFYEVSPKVSLKDPKSGENVTVEVGGQVELFGLFELEYPLIREAGLKFVTFYDVGNAFTRFPGTGGEAFKLKQDVGFGFRWFSPIGPLRFEWGYPINRKPNEDSSQFIFFIGPPF